MIFLYASYIRNYILRWSLYFTGHLSSWTRYNHGESWLKFVNEKTWRLIIGINESGSYQTGNPS